MKTIDNVEIYKNMYVSHHNTKEIIKITDFRDDIVWYNDIVIDDNGNIIEDTPGGSLTAREFSKCSFY